MFRPDSAPLTPNWKHLPIGYHGRAGTVAGLRHAGGPPVRPAQGAGRRRAHVRPVPAAGHRGGGRLRRRRRVRARLARCRWPPSPSTSSASAWSTTGRPATCRPGSTCRSARSSASRSSPRSRRGWCRWPRSRPPGCAPPARDVPLLPYLDDDAGDPWGLDIRLEVRLNGELLSCPPFDLMYWTAAQQLAHMTVNGASLRTGDLFASGTVSGPAKDQRGSFIELSWGGKEPLTLADGIHPDVPRGRRRRHASPPPPPAPAAAGSPRRGDRRGPAGPVTRHSRRSKGLRSDP